MYGAAIVWWTALWRASKSLLVMLATAQINVFSRVLLCVSLSCCSPIGQKIFFYYKALIFLKLFFIRVFVFVRKTRDFSLSRAELCCWIKKRGHISLHSSLLKNGFFKSECFVRKIFCLEATVDHGGYRKKFVFGGYASLLIIKNLNFFRAV